MVHILNQQRPSFNVIAARTVEIVRQESISKN